MIPFIVLIISFGSFIVLGQVGVSVFSGWHAPLRFALAVMFLLTASAHRGKRRADLVLMVPSTFPRPEAIVTATGILELLGALGLLLPAMAGYAAVGLSLLLVAMFPANVHAARSGLFIAGRPATPLGLRTLLQLVFLAATITVAATYLP